MFGRTFCAGGCVIHWGPGRDHDVMRALHGHSSHTLHGRQAEEQIAFCLANCPIKEGTADILLELFSSEVLPHQGIQSDTAITGKIYPRVAELFCLNIHPDFTPHHTDILDNWSSSDRSRRLVDLHLVVERTGCSTILATIRSILGWLKRY